MTTQQPTSIAELEDKTREELVDLALQIGMEDGSSLSALSRGELVQRLLQSQAEQKGVLLASGILELMSDGYGFLRQNGLLRPG
ncbi:MAG: hypothetical protein V1724_02390, partial [Chloroflexota bacterium]